MKIMIEAFALRNVKSGTGRYALDIITSLSKHHDITAVTREPDPEALKNLPTNVKVISANNFRFIPANAYLYLFLGHFLKKYQFDFAIFLIGCRPLFFNKIYDLVICDFNHKIFPKSVKFITRQIYRISSFWSIKNCRYLISISEGTSIKSKKFYGRESDLIINPSLLKFKNIQPRMVSDIPKDFSIYVGAIEPRKNICNLLVAHEYAVDNGLISDKLLLVSSQSWFEGEVKSLLSKMEHSILLSSIEEDELAWLYSHANRVYMTTFYEGYGMPAAEGQAFGANIICTDIIELREASKNKAIYVGTSAIDIYEGIGLSLKRGTSPDTRTFDCSLDLYEKQIDIYLKRISDSHL